jgi:hypothetical protein
MVDAGSTDRAARGEAMLCDSSYLAAAPKNLPRASGAGVAAGARRAEAAVP